MRAVHVLGAGLSGLSAAIVLARAGRSVHVHDIRHDSGTRFAGDFQGIENWSPGGDFLTSMRRWGLDPGDFTSVPFHQADLVDPTGRIHHVASPTPAFRIVERGTAPHTIDQSLKRQAAAAGAALHYGTHRSPADCDLVATGPLGTTGIVYGELFETSAPNRATLQFNDRLAPGGYTYLLVIDGVGLIATALLRRQRDPDRFLDETIAWYEDHYPRIDRRPIRRFGGHAAFALADRYAVDGRAWIGEAAGLQDCLWGFGIRHAVTSGVLAARWLLGELDYEAEIRRTIVPQLEASVASRWLLERLGQRGMAAVTRLWLRQQRRSGDGLAFLAWLYRGSPALRLLNRVVGGFVLEPVRRDDGRTIRICNARPAVARDRWPRSVAGRRVADTAARRTASTA